MTSNNLIHALYGHRAPGDPAFVIPGGPVLSTADVLAAIDRAAGAPGGLRRQTGRPSLGPGREMRRGRVPGPCLLQGGCHPPPHEHGLHAAGGGDAPGRTHDPASSSAIPTRRKRFRALAARHGFPVGGTPRRPGFVCRAGPGLGARAGCRGVAGGRTRRSALYVRHHRPAQGSADHPRQSGRKRRGAGEGVAIGSLGTSCCTRCPPTTPTVC